MPKGNCDIRIRDISYRYGSDTVLSHFSYTFEKGFIYGITAPSGTGKTTLLNLIGNVLKPAQGEIETDFKTGIAYVFQEPELLSQLTIAENIALPLAAYLKKEIAFEQAISILQKMELDGFENRFPNELNKAFAPEFLNRVDDIIMFDQLDKEAIHKIIDIELQGLYKRVAGLGYSLELTDAAKDFVATKGYDIQFGARPLKRAIQKYLEDEMAEMIIRASVGEGDTIVVDFDKDKQEIVTNVKKSESAAEA